MDVLRLSPRAPHGSRAAAARSRGHGWRGHGARLRASGGRHSAVRTAARHHAPRLPRRQCGEHCGAMIAGSAMSRFARAPVVGLLAIVAVLPARAENITFITDFGFNGRHAYYYVALERGYYRQAGLDVSFVRGHGSADAIRKVGAGAAQIGFSDAGSLVLARAKDGVPVRMVAAVYAAPPHPTHATADGSIRRPQKLVGHRIAASAASANPVVFAADAK